jgi:hypothetical protein
MHALGFVTLGWNLCEYWAGALMADVLGVPESVSRVIIHDMGDITLWGKLIDLARAKKFPSPVIAELEYASRLYERCRSNRNQFVHASTVASRSEDGSAVRLARLKGPTLESTQISDDLSDVRRAGEDIDRLEAFLEKISLALFEIRNGKPWPSLERPPLPEFVWKPAPPAPPKPKLPPKSSRQ